MATAVISGAFVTGLAACQGYWDFVEPLGVGTNRRKLGPQDQALERDLDLSPLLIFLFAFQPPSDEQSVLPMPPATMTHHRP